MDRNLDAKFGPAPSLPSLVLPTPTLLGTQVVVCVLLLVLVQPPFVMSPPSTSGRVPTLCLSRVLSVSLLATGTSLVLHRAGAQPGTLFRAACEVASRASRA